MLRIIVFDGATDVCLRSETLKIQSAVEQMNANVCAKCGNNPPSAFSIVALTPLMRLAAGDFARKLSPARLNVDNIMEYAFVNEIRLTCL